MALRGCRSKKEPASPSLLLCCVALSFVMRIATTLLLLAALTACSVAQSSLNPSGCSCKHDDLPLCKDVCHKPKLTAQQKIELQQANKDVSKRLNPDAHSVIHTFIDQLEDEHQTYVKLSSPINQGHSIRFKFLEGEEAAIEEAAAHLGLHVKGDSIEIPDDLASKLRESQKEEHHAATQAASEKWAEARKADQEGEVHLPDVASKYISPEQAANLHNSNRANLKPWAAQKILKFLKAVADSHNHIRLYGAIKDGHVIDYEVVNGVRSEVKALGHDFDLEVTDNSISTQGETDVHEDSSDHPVKVSDAFHADKPEEHAEKDLSGNCAAPRCPKDDDVVIVPAPGRALRSNQPNTMLVNIYTPPGGPKIID